MSTVTLYQKSESLIKAQEKLFDKLAMSHGAVKFETESYYALDILKGNEYMLSVASGNPESLKSAILHVATTGLSLSPYEKLAYLVPRNKKICLDISYFGMLKVATDSQAIKWGVAEIVYEKDQFIFNGHGKEPRHNFDPYDDERGAIKGAYCLAKTFNDEFLCSMMPIKEIYAIRDRSESWKAFKQKGKPSPWVTDEKEMIKKTVIRRASKSWPKSSTNDSRLPAAIAAFDDVNAIDVEGERVEYGITESQILEIQNLLKVISRTEVQYLGHLMRLHKRKIESLSELTKMETEQALVELYGITSKMTAKAATEELKQSQETQPDAEPLFTQDEIREANGIKVK